MKVLFVSSGKSGKISPIVKAQGNSLEKIGIRISYFLIQGKGFLGYLRNIPKLRKHLKKNHYDVIHVHYSLTAFVASLANAKPLAVSLMGSDVKGNKSVRYILKLFCKYIWSAVIVKSEDMKKSLGYDYSYVIPNGVDIDKFKPTDKVKSQNELKWENQKLHLLFAADPDRTVKNYSLFEQGVKKLRKSYKNIEINFLRNVDMDKVPLYMNAADIVCLSSYWEGSPNVIKEAMACNRPIVCTDVGDVKWLFDDNKLEGHFISDFDANSFGNQLLEAMNYSIKNGETKGRIRIKRLGLDSSSISQKLRQIYDELLYQANY